MKQDNGYFVYGLFLSKKKCGGAFIHKKVNITVVLFQWKKRIRLCAEIEEKL